MTCLLYNISQTLIIHRCYDFIHIWANTFNNPVYKGTNIHLSCLVSLLGSDIYAGAERRGR